MKYLSLFFSLLAALLTSHSATACIIGKSGPQYDKLIQLEKLDDFGHFSISIPNTIGIFNSAPMVNVLPPSSGFKDLSSNRITPFMVNHGDQMVGEFQINLNQPEAYKIRVYWPPKQAGLCGVSAKSEIIPAFWLEQPIKQTPSNQRAD